MNKELEHVFKCCLVASCVQPSCDRRGLSSNEYASNASFSYIPGASTLVEIYHRGYCDHPPN